MIIRDRHRALPLALAVLSMIGGVLASVHYRRLGSDAQPLRCARASGCRAPHLRQPHAGLAADRRRVAAAAPSAQRAARFRWTRGTASGASAVAISIAAFAIAVGVDRVDRADAHRLGRSPRSPAHRCSRFNPNVLYLQATPMTEPLLLGLTTLGVALLLNWCGTPDIAGLKFRATAVTADGGRAGLQTRTAPTAAVGVVLALACLTRYEAWPVTAAALVAAAWVRWRRGESPSVALRQVAMASAYPAAGILAFAVFSRVVIGEWFVASGFFVPENKALGSPLAAVSEIGWGVQMLSGPTLTYLGAAAAAVLVLLGLVRARWAGGLVVLALSATAAVPWVAFLDGHPFRIRYMVPLIAFQGAAAGIAVGLLPRARDLRRWCSSRLSATS